MASGKVEIIFYSFVYSFSLFNETVNLFGYEQHCSVVPFVQRILFIEL